MDSAMPPVPPQVAAQQAGPPPIRQFAQGGAAAQPAGVPPAMANSDQLLAQLVDDAGKTLTKIAEITGQTKPELIPILKQAVQALVMFAGKVKTGDQGAPDGGSQGTAAGGSPDAGGSAAMGMPQ